MKTSILAALLLASCAFPPPTVHLAAPGPVELEYREAKGGLVVLRGKVNGRADVDFILDTGAPVTVLIDGPNTAPLGLDSSKARPLGDPKNPGTPTGDIQGGFKLAFGALTLDKLTAVVIPQKTMPCRERFDEIGFGGVIGADLFREFVVEVDTVARRVKLHDPKTWSPPKGYASLPITFRNGHPFVDARVTLADGRQVDTPMNVDIGMNRPITLVAGSHEAITMPTEGKVRKSCFVNGTREEREGAAVTVHLGTARIPVEAPVYSSSANPVNGGRASTIGVGLFQKQRLLIDYPGKRLFVG